MWASRERGWPGDPSISCCPRHALCSPLDALRGRSLAQRGPFIIQENARLDSGTDLGPDLLPVTDPRHQKAFPCTFSHKHLPQRQYVQSSWAEHLTTQTCREHTHHTRSFPHTESPQGTPCSHKRKTNTHTVVSLVAFCPSVLERLLCCRMKSPPFFFTAADYSPGGPTDKCPFCVGSLIWQQLLRGHLGLPGTLGPVPPCPCFQSLCLLFWGPALA